MTISNFPSAIEAYELHKLSVAKEHGFALFHIGSDELSPGFVYSVGMSQHDLPEILCFFEADFCEETNSMMVQLCRKLIEGVKHFDRGTLLRTFIRNGITATDPVIHYVPELLTGEELLYCYQTHTTRAIRLRHDLGIPKGVIVLNHEGVPLFSQQRAERMFADAG